MAMSPPSSNDFQQHLDGLLVQARTLGFSAVEIISRDLHQAVGGYPDPNHRMPVCCEVMRDRMASGDEIVSQPPNGDGATVRIRYQIR